jgi:hypothetical protein
MRNVRVLMVVGIGMGLLVIVSFLTMQIIFRQASQRAAMRISQRLISRVGIESAARSGQALSMSELDTFPDLKSVVEQDLGNLDGVFYLLSESDTMVVGPVWLPGSGNDRGKFVMEYPSGLVYYLAYPVSAVTQFAASIDVTLEPADTGRSNPFIGWAPWASSLPTLEGPFTMAYAGVDWCDLEPEEGVFDFTSIEVGNNFDFCRAHGIRLVLRMILDYPNAGKEMQIPKWLYDKMSQDGTWYENDDGTGGFGPNYANPVLIEAHQRLIAALGARYDQDPLIAFVQLGSLGQYGEWYVSPRAGRMPEDSVIDQYVTHYKTSFPDKVFMFRRPVVQLGLVRAGIFNDMFGDKRSTDRWLGWIANGADEEFKSMVAAPDFWTIGPSGGEFANGDANFYIRGDTIEETRRQVLASHTSLLGPCAPVAFDSREERDNAASLLDLMGYRFRILTVRTSRVIEPGSRIHFEQTWQNLGNSPMYYDWPVSMRLSDGTGRVVTNWVLDTDTRTWLPGRFGLSDDIDLPAQLAAGKYSFSVAILDPSSGLPGIQLANASRDPDGYSALCTVQIR